MKLSPLLIMLLVSASYGVPTIEPNAPEDRPALFTQDQIAALDRAIAPYAAQAKKTYPDAKNRFLAGLPPQHKFYLTTRIKDSDGKQEQVFILVDHINGTEVSGRICSPLSTVKEFEQGQTYIFHESEVLDWLITKPGGKEEGNFVGKFMDTYKP